MGVKPQVAVGAIVFMVVPVAGLGFAGYGIVTRISNVGEQNIASSAFVLLGCRRWWHSGSSS